MSAHPESLGERDEEIYRAFHAEALQRYKEILRNGHVVSADAIWAYLRTRMTGDNPAAPETLTLLQEELSILIASEGSPP